MTFVEERIAGDHYATAYHGDGFNVTNLLRLNISPDMPNHVLVNDNTGLISSTAILNVARGGTGASTFGANNIIIGNGISPLLDSGVDVTTLVTPTSATTFTNKIIVDPTNDVTARSLFTGSGAGSVSVYAATAPAIGQVLTATSPTMATWQTPGGGGGSSKCIITMTAAPLAINTFLVYETHLYFPWSFANYTGYTSGKIITDVRVDSSAVLIQLYNATTATSLGTVPAAVDGIVEFPFTLPGANASLIIRTQKTTNDLKHPYLYGVHMLLVP